MVVSVGPYMFRIVPWQTASSSEARETGNASPPIIRCGIRPRAVRVSGSVSSMVAWDGVHWRWVTPWRSTWAAKE